MARQDLEVLLSSTINTLSGAEAVLKKLAEEPGADARLYAALACVRECKRSLDEAMLELDASTF